MNVYCIKCGSEMEIMVDLGSELKVFPCGCGNEDNLESAQQGVEPTDFTDARIDEMDAIASSFIDEL